jgi:protein-S-isoprenylcysteine O-methyltransferase Ste14
VIFAGFYIIYRAWVVLHAAQQEGKLVRQEFGSAYDKYAMAVPAFLPSWKRTKIQQQGGTT